MKTALITAIAILCAAVIFLFFEPMELRHSFTAKMGKKSDEFALKILTERENISDEFQGKYKDEMKKFAETVDKLKEEKAKTKILEESKTKTKMPEEKKAKPSKKSKR